MEKEPHTRVLLRRARARYPFPILYDIQLIAHRLVQAIGRDPYSKGFAESMDDWELVSGVYDLANQMALLEQRK